MSQPKITHFSAVDGTYLPGQTVTIRAFFDQAVGVDASLGVPMLVLSNGAVARYASGTGTNALSFSYVVGAGDRSSSDLNVIAVAENDARITGVTGGLPALTTVVPGSAGNDLAHLQAVVINGSSSGTGTGGSGGPGGGTPLVDTLPPHLLQMNAAAGTYQDGQAVTITLHFDEIVNVQGVPVLALNNGREASYVGGTGSQDLQFTYAIQKGDNPSTGLDVTAVSLNGGAIRDVAGNAAVLDVITSGPSANHLSAFSPIIINAASNLAPVYGDSIAPTVVGMMATGGVYRPGEEVRIKVQLSEPVSVNVATVDGKPQLPELVLGVTNPQNPLAGMARYVGGSGTDVLEFAYTVGVQDRLPTLNGVPMLEAQGLVLDTGGRMVRDAAGNPLNDYLSGAAGQIQYDPLGPSQSVVLDAVAPVLTGLDAGVDRHYKIGDTVELTVSFDQPVQVAGRPTLTLSNGAVATYVSGSSVDATANTAAIDSRTLTFQYEVKATDASDADLSIVRVDTTGGSILGLGGSATLIDNLGQPQTVGIGHQPAELAVTASDIAAFRAEHAVFVDTALPNGTITLLNSLGQPMTAVKKGDTALVKLSFGEPVTLDNAAVTVEGGVLSDLITQDGGRNWIGTLSPTANTQQAQNLVRLDNSRVLDLAGNTGVGESVSTVYGVDTVLPQATITSAVTDGGKGRLFTIDFGEPVSPLQARMLTVTGGSKGAFTKVSDSVYTQAVTVTTAVLTQPDGHVTLSLASGAVKDANGNASEAQSLTRYVDETAPVIRTISATNGLYQVGQDILIDVRFSEAVAVDTQQGTPFLSLSNGGKAEFVAATPAGSPYSTVQTFKYTVQAGDVSADLDVRALVHNGAKIQDVAHNDANVKVTLGSNNLAYLSNVQLDGIVPEIVGMSATDGVYIGDPEPDGTTPNQVDIHVKFSEAVFVAPGQGTGALPILALSNGAVARYMGGSGTKELTFSYVVQPGDLDSSDLDVLALAENNARITDGSGGLGNPASVTLKTGFNNLAKTSAVVIDAEPPQIDRIVTPEGHYKAGSVMDLTVVMDKPVNVDLEDPSQLPTITLSNQGHAIFAPSKSTPTQLVFEYVVQSSDQESTELGLIGLDLNGAHLVGSSRNLADLGSLDPASPNAIAADQPLILANGHVSVDLTAPEVQSLVLGDAQLKAGESTPLTVRFTEAVQGVTAGLFDSPNGRLGNFTTPATGPDAGKVWTATFTPNRSVEDPTNVITLNTAGVRDLAGNVAVTPPGAPGSSANYQVDTKLPGVVIHSDAGTLADAHEDVRFTLDFSEPVTLDLQQASRYLHVEGGTPGTLEQVSPTQWAVSVTPNPVADGVPASPIKVRVDAGFATDLSGNTSTAAASLAQNLDGDIPHIVSVDALSGNYRVGSTLDLTVRFSEAVTLQPADAGIQNPVQPVLFLNNGALATYTSGSGTDTLHFSYTMAADDGQVDHLQVLALLENDRLITDIVGHRAEVTLSGEELQSAIAMDSTGPQITGFSALDGAYRSGQVVWIKALMSEDVLVQNQNGVPELTLSNGGKATYVSGSGGRELLFKYTVGTSDLNTGDLNVTAVNLHGGMIQDRAGNGMDTALSSDFAQDHQVVIDTRAPSIAKISTATARIVGANGLEADQGGLNHNGYYEAGQTLELTVKFDDVVQVDTLNNTRLPKLTLSNGQLATYIGGGGTDTLHFAYTVRGTDINSADLKVLGLAENGAKLTDAAGNIALVKVSADENLASDLDVVVDTKAPTLTISDNFEGLNGGEPVTYTLNFSEKMLQSSLSEAELQSELHHGTVQAGSLQWSQDGRSATFNVIPDDRFLGDMTLNVPAGSITDMAGNGLLRAAASAQPVDTQTVHVQVSAFAGPFIASDSQVRMYDGANGNLLTGASYTLDPVTGQVTITVTNSPDYPQGFRGTILVEVRDTSSGTDYRDEYTGEYRSLSESGAPSVLRAMVNIDKPSTFPVSVTPLTELAVSKAGIAAETLTSHPLSESTVINFNSGVQKIFGLATDIVKTPVTTLFDSHFNTADGITAPEAYGQVLTLLSARDSQTGSIRSTLDQLAQQITVIQQTASNGAPLETLAIKQAGAVQLVEALTAVQTNTPQNPVLPTSGIDLGLLKVAYIQQASVQDGTSGINLAESQNIDIPVKGAHAGDTVWVRWGSQPAYAVTVLASQIGTDGVARIPVPQAVIRAQGDAPDVPVSFSIGQGTVTQEPPVSSYTAPVLLKVDIVPPVVSVSALEQVNGATLVQGTATDLNAGDNFYVQVNGQYTYQVTPDANGHWTLDVTTAIPQGATAPVFALNDGKAVYSAVASVEDLSGNADSASERNVLIIDAVSDIASTPASQSLLDAVLNVKDSTDLDTSAKLQNLATAVNAVLETGATPLADATASPLTTAQLNDLNFQTVTDANLNAVKRALAADLTTVSFQPSAVELMAPRLSVGETSEIVFHFASPVQNLSALDLSLANGSVSGLNSTDGGLTWVGTFTATTDVLQADGTVNYTPEVPTIRAAAASLVAGASTAVTLTFTAEPSAVDLRDYQVAGGTLGNLGTVHQTRGVNAQGIVVDLWEVTATLTATQAIPNTAQAITPAFAMPSISLADSSLSIGQSTVATLHFDTAHPNLTADDLTIAGGVFTGLRTTDGGLTWTGTFTAKQTVEVASEVYVVDQRVQLAKLIEQTTQAADQIAAFVADGVHTPAPTLTTFENAYVEGVNATNLSAIRDAMNTVSWTPGADIFGNVQSLVTSYNVIQAQADYTGTGTPPPAPTAADYTHVGVTLSSVPALQAQQVSLLGGVIAAKDFAGVDTVQEIQDLTNAATRVIGNATTTTVLASQADLNLLGFTATSNNLTALQKVLAIQPDTGATIDTYAELATLMNNAVSAFNAVTAAANAPASSPTTPPTATQFAQMGISGVTSDAIAAAIDTALASATTTANTLEQVQAIATSYNTILTRATDTTGRAPAPSADDYAAVGLQLTQGTAPANQALRAAQVDLLGGVIAAKDFADVNTVQELDALLQASTRVLQNASDARQGTQPILASTADLNLLGFAATADNLSALQKVLSNQGTTDAVNTYGELSALMTNAVAAFDVITTAANDTSGNADLPSAIQFAQMGVAHVTPSRLDAINDALLSGNTTAQNQGQVQTIVDSYNTILNRADDAAAPAPTASDYAAIGISGIPLGTTPAETALRDAQVNLLGTVIGTKAQGDVDTVQEVQNLLDASARVLANAAGTRDSQGQPILPSVEDLQLLGFDATPDNLTALQKVLLNQGNTGAVDTFAELQTLMQNAISGFNAVTAAANAQAGDTSVTAPTALDFAHMGVAGVNDVRLAAINDALASGNTTAQNLGEVQSLVDSYNVVLDRANNPSAPAPIAADYGRIGVTGISGSNATLATAQVQLLGSVIAAKDTTAVDTIQEVQDLLDASSRVLGNASGTSLATQADLTLLGFAATPNNLSALQQVLANQADNGSSIDTYTELSTLMNAAIQSFDVITAAANAAPGVSVAIPNVSDYANMGVTNVTSTNRSAINNALANGNTTAQNLSQVQGIVDSYNKILDRAVNDASPAPSDADYTRIGVTLSSNSALKGQQVALLGGVLAAKDFPNVDTVTEVQNLVDAATRVIGNAANTQASGQPVLASEADLTLLGFSATPNNLTALQKVLSNVGNAAGVTSFSTLSTLMTDAVSAFNAVTAAANAPANTPATPPTAAQFAAMGVSGVTSDAIATAINDSLASARTSANTLEQVQAIATSYNKILTLAADTTGTALLPSAADYTTMGVQLAPASATALRAAQVDLLDSVIAAKDFADVNTVQEVQNLLDAATRVLQNATGAVVNGAPVLASQADLQLLGFAATPDNLTTLQKVLRDQGNTDAVNSYGEVETLMLNAIQGFNVVTAAANADPASPAQAPTTTDYAHMGITGVDTVNLSAINNAMASGRTTAQNLQEVQAIVTSYNHVKALADDANASLPTAQDYTTLGIQLATSDADLLAEQVAFLDSIVASGDFAAVDTVQEIQSLLDAATRVLQNANGTQVNGAPVQASVADLQLLGITGASTTNLSSLQKVLTDRIPQGGMSDVDSVSEFTTLMTNAVAAFNVVTAAANATAQAPTTPPTTLQYRQMGIDGVTDTNVSAMNNALARGNTSAQNLGQVQAIVSSYNKVLDRAVNDNSPAPNAQDYANLGVLVSQDLSQAGVALATAQVGLLGTVIAAKDFADVDTVQDVQNLLDAATRVLGNASNTQQNSTAVLASAADLNLLGFAATTDNLSTLQKVLSNQNGLAPVDSYSELATLMNNAVTAFNVITTAANAAEGANLAVTPTPTHFAQMAVTGVTTDNLSAVLNALRSPTTTAHSLADIQNLVDGYNSVIALANDPAATPRPTADNLTDLGGVLTADAGLEAAQVSLTDDIIAARAFGDVDTVQELQSFLDATNAIVLQSKATGATALISIPQLALLGINVSADELAAVNARIALTADDGSGIDTLADLQALVSATQASLARITAYANSDGTTAVPDLTDYQNIGVVSYHVGNQTTPITQTHLSAINALFAATTVGNNEQTDHPANTPLEIQDVIDSAGVSLAAFAKIAAYAENNAVDTATYPAPTAEDYIDAGFAGVSTSQAARINDLLKTTASDTHNVDADTHAELVKFVALGKIAAYANADGVGQSAPTLQDYLDAGLTGVTQRNLSAANQLFAATTVGADTGDTPAGTRTEQQAVLTAAGVRMAAIDKISTYAEVDGVGVSAPTPADFTAAGATGVTADNLAEVLTAFRAMTGAATDTPEEVQAVIHDTAVTKIAAYANADGANGTPVPTLQDYQNAGLTGVTTYNLAAANVLFAATNVGADPSDTPAGNQTQQQSVLTAASAKLAAIDLISHYAQNDGNGVPAPQLQDYINAGVSGVTSANINDVNAALIPYAGVDVDTSAEIQSRAIVGAAIAKIAAYANTDGVSATPTVLDYANAGLTGVTAYNLATANQLFAAPGVGNAQNDTRPAGTLTQQQAVLTAASAKLVAIDLISHYAEDSNQAAPATTDYANAGVTGVSSTNLTEVNTAVAAKIGTEADTTTEVQAIIHDAAVAKIATWSDAEGASGTPVPTAQDYLNAGLTRVTNYNLGTANELFAASGVVDGSVATQAAQQSILDAASSKLTAIDKIGNYATATTLPTGSAVPTAADYDAAGVSGVAGPGGAVNFYSNITDVNAAMRPSGGVQAAATDTTAEIQHYVAPPVLLSKASQFNALGATAYQNVGSLFNYTAGPYPDSTAGDLTLSVFKDGIVKNSGAVLDAANAGATQLFDETTTGNNSFVDYYNTSPTDPAILGWVDKTGYYTQPNLLKEIRVYPRTGWSQSPGRLPSTLDIEGYNAGTGQWEVLNHIVRQPLHNSNGADIPLNKSTISTFSSYSSAVGSLPAYQTYAVNATKPYDGYRIKVFETIDAAAKAVYGSFTWTDGSSPAGTMLGPNEVQFMSQQVTPITVAPSLQEYVNAGLTGATAENLHAVNEVVAASPSSALTTLQGVTPLVATGETNYEAKLALVVAYANGTSQVVPTAADYYTAGFNNVNNINLYAVNKAILAASVDDHAAGVTAVAQGVQDQLNAVRDISVYADASSGTAPDTELYRVAGLSTVIDPYLPLVNAAIQAKTTTQTDTYVEIAAVIDAKLAPLNTLLADLITRQPPSRVDTAAELLPAQTSLAKFYQVSDLATGADASSIGLTANQINLILGKTVANAGNLAALTAKIVGTPDWTSSDLFATQYQVSNALSHNAYINSITVKSSATLGISAYTLYASDGYQPEGQNVLEKMKVSLSGAVVNDVVTVWNGTTQVFTKTLTATDITNGYVETGEINASTNAPVTGHAKFSVKVNGADQTDVWHYTYGTSDQARSLISAAANGDTAASDYPSLGDYAQAGVTGVAHWNIASINSALDTASIATGQADTAAHIQTIVNAYNKIITYNLDHTQPAPVVADYTAIGVTGVDSTNESTVNGLIGALASTRMDSSQEIQAIVTINNYNNSGGTTTAPTVDNYTYAGVTGVSPNNLQAVNAQLVALGPGHGDTAAHIQPAVTNANAALALIESYNNGDGTSPAALTVQDYVNAGVTGVTAGNLKAVNYQVLNSATGATDTNPEIAAKVTLANTAIAKIEAYNNGTGSTTLPDGTTTLTIQDYANAGIVNVSDFNLADTNAQVLGASSGGADTCDEIQGLVALAKISAYAVDSRLVRPGGTAFNFFPSDLTTGTSNGEYASTSTSKGQGEITSSGWTTGGFQPYFAFDGNTDTTHSIESVTLTGPITATIGWRDTTSPEPTFLKELVLTTRPTWASRFPKVWHVEGYSSDTQSWVTLASYDYTGQSNPAGSTSAAHDVTFSVNATQTCTGYRLVFDEAFPGQGSENIVNLGEIKANVQHIETRTLPTLDEYVAAGVTGLNEHTVYTMNQQVDAYNASGVISLATVQGMVSGAQTAQQAALAIINTYAQSGGTKPTLENYLQAGALHMTAQQLNAVNAEVDALSGVADATALQVAVDQGMTDQTSHLLTIQNYVNGTSGATLPTLTDYHLAGFDSVVSLGSDAVAGASLYLKNLHTGGLGTDYSSMNNKLNDWKNSVNALNSAITHDTTHHTAADFDTSPELAAINHAVLDYAAVIELASGADYTSQFQSDYNVHLTTQDINLMLGTATATDSNLMDIISKVAHEKALPVMSLSANYTTDQAKFYEMSEVLKSDAFVESAAPHSLNDNSPSVVVRLVDAVANDTLKIYSEGVLQATHTLTQTDVDNGKVSFNNVGLGTNSTTNDAGATNFGLKAEVVHGNINNPTVQSDEWLYRYS